MPETLMFAVIAVAAVLTLGLTALVLRSKGPPRPGRRPIHRSAADFPRDAREERLARQVARAVGCSVPQALPAVRREVRIAPDQTDETLVKRAVYHYRHEQPEAPCPVFRDRAPG